MNHPSLFIRVPRTTEFTRIEGLPRVEWEYSPTDKGREWRGWVFRAMQELAAATWESDGALVCAIRVGGGKTLVTAWLAERFENPLVLVPGSLVARTVKEFAELGVKATVWSYQSLGLEKNAHAITALRPDIIIADEAQYLGGRKAAVTRRVWRYLTGRPDCRFVPLSGTLFDKTDRAAALCSRALGELSPLPRGWGEAEVWKKSLEGDIFTLPGVLGGTPQEARAWVAERTRTCPGVVVSAGASECSASINIHAHVPEPDPLVQAAIKKLRATWTLPDDTPLMQAPDVWARAQQLALGVFYRWDPKPPPWWLLPRAEWAAACREILSRSRTIDTEKQLKTAVAEGKYPHVRGLLAAWEKVQGEYTPRTVVETFSTAPADDVAQLLEENTIVFTGLSTHGRELARYLGVPWVGEMGLVDGTDAPIESLGGKTCVASLRANGTGKRLQAWQNIVCLAAPKAAGTHEQMIGRLHREGQQADEVNVTYRFLVREHVSGFLAALEEARALRDINPEHKFLIATHNYDVARVQQKACW